MLNRQNLSKIPRKFQGLLRDVASYRFLRVTRYHGLDVLVDIKTRTSSDINVIFDVGANIGQSAKEYAKHFPNATIYCFEPISKTFEILDKKLARKKNVHCFKLAFGAQEGEIEVPLQELSLENTLLDHPELDCAGADSKTEVVIISTIEKFCQEHGIEHIDFLKIDTEGYDLEVLKGAQSLMDAGRVTYVQVETGMNHYNKKHVPFQNFSQFVEEKDYVLFGIYGQIQKWWEDKARLRFCNLVFIADQEVAVKSRPGVKQLMY